MTQTISIVCPVYNEEDVIIEFYHELREVLEKLCNIMHFEIIFVLDRSDDRTQEMIENICADDKRVKLILMSNRFGNPMSIVAGIDHAKSDVVITMDSDLQHPPSLIPAFLDHYYEGYEIVVGVRTKDEGKGFAYSWFSRSFYKIWGNFSGFEICPGEGDFRLISARVADIFRCEIREHNQFLRGLFRWVGFKRATVEFIAPDRGAGETKFTKLKLISFAFKSIFMFSNKPIYFAVFAGILTIFLSFLGTSWFLFQYISTGNEPDSLPIVLIAVLLLAGIQMLFFGIIGQYITLILDEVRDRPLYVINKKVNFE